jgi:hypothetical protein
MDDAAAAMPEKTSQRLSAIRFGARGRHHQR